MKIHMWAPRTGLFTLSLRRLCISLPLGSTSLLAHCPRRLGFYSFVRSFSSISHFANSHQQLKPSSRISALCFSSFRLCSLLPHISHIPSFLTDAEHRWGRLNKYPMYRGGPHIFPFMIVHDSASSSRIDAIQPPLWDLCLGLLRL